MINSEEVKYKGITDLIILKDTGVYSIAVLRFNGTTKYGIRWNGDGNSLGTPTSHGTPTWFILPDEVIDMNIKIKL